MLKDDPRVDPRLRAMFGDWTAQGTERQNWSREQLLAWEESAEGRAQAAAADTFFDSMDCLASAPPDGLRTHVETFQTAPGSASIKILFTRPVGDAPQACIYYVHGGGMQALSCFDGMYRAWARLIAAKDVCVAMVDFRNSLRPSSAREVAPFPAGLDDCVAGFRWMHCSAASLGIDTQRITIAGDSGGGNLAIATVMRLIRDGQSADIHGLYALCPFIAGHGPHPEHPSSAEYDGFVLDSRALATGVTAYGRAAFDARNPLAWPSFASVDDVAGFPPTMISVNECDPLRDEGIAFYRLLLRAGVAARCRQVMGTTHGTEIFVKVCPDISADTARDLAAFGRRESQ